MTYYNQISICLVDCVHIGHNPVIYKINVITDRGLVALKLGMCCAYLQVSDCGAISNIQNTHM